MADAGIKQLLDAMRQENAAAQAETRRHFDVSVERVEKKMDASVAELRRHFDVANEATQREIKLVAEAVIQLDGKFERKFADLEERMDRGFADTQAMIKFSHAELDRRVRALEQSQRTLEEGFADLQARVERLEGTH